MLLGPFLRAAARACRSDYSRHWRQCDPLLNGTGRLRLDLANRRRWHIAPGTANGGANYVAGDRPGVAKITVMVPDFTCEPTITFHVVIPSSRSPDAAPSAQPSPQVPANPGSGGDGPSPAANGPLWLLAALAALLAGLGLYLAGPALLEFLGSAVAASIFWSGGSTAESIAEEFADAIGGKTIGMSPFGSIGEELQAALEADGAPWEQIRQNVWEPLSQQFAGSAQGTATAFVNNLNPNSVWASVEYPTLMNNPAINQISINYLDNAPLTEGQWFTMGDAWSGGGASIP